MAWIIDDVKGFIGLLFLIGFFGIVLTFIAMAGFNINPFEYLSAGISSITGGMSGINTTTIGGLIP